MLVLITAIASLLVVSILLGLRLSAPLRESRHSWRRTAPEPLFAGLRYDHALDEDYGLIWQTQLPALELIRCGGPAGLPVQALRPWFQRTMHSYPDLFEGHTFEEWLEFLQRSRVARLGRDKVLLTALGCELLNHCRMAG